jgi:Protein of unknown function (DUF3999)
MKTFASVLLLFLAASSSTSYFRYRRETQATSSSGQHYFVVDETFWWHARPDLSDVRMYIGETEIPYKFTVHAGSVETEQKEFRVLQPASVSGKTQFVLDMSSVAEYDRVNLRLSTKNFVARARVEGQDDAHGTHWALLGTTTLYDLADEKLGQNSTLQIPLSAYKYLRVTVDSAVKPADVQSGTAGVTRSQKAVWRELHNEPKLEQQGKNTVLTFAVPANAPVDRVAFDIDIGQKNFRREIEIRGDQDQTFASGEISRIHMERNGQNVDVEQTFLDLYGNRQGILKVIIHNGDDPPLKITGGHLQQVERRIYFDTDAGVKPWIYYGDEKLGSPEYDYAKLFQQEKNADQVALNAEEANSAYSGRPDSRPWSERHPAVLWAAIVAAVLILGAVAVRSLKTASPSS